MSITKLLVLGICGALLLSCATMQESPGQLMRQVTGEELVQTLDPGFSPDKAVYDPISGNVFVLDRRSQKVSIFTGSKLVNVVGGIGYENSSFKRLNDIEIDSDGALLCLDGLARVVKRFDSQGAYRSEISISDLAQPELLCTGPDQTMFVYDRTQGELVCLSALDHTEQYRFGKFLLKEPASLTASKDYLIAHSSDGRTSTLFSILGQSLGEYDGLWIVDAQKLFIGASSTQSGHIPLNSAYSHTLSAYASYGLIRSFSGHQGFITLVRNDQVSVFRLKYGEGE